MSKICVAIHEEKHDEACDEGSLDKKKLLAKASMRVEQTSLLIIN